MIVTEEEAKIKRCQESFPAMRYTSADGAAFASAMGGGSAYAAPTAPAFCIGPACMAWRWQRTQEWVADTQTGRILEPRVGYCGKAGKP